MTPERLAEIRKRWSNGPNPMDDPPENEISDWLDMRELLDHIAQLEAQRGGVVVVPEFDWDKAHEKAKTLFESYDDLSPVIYANGGAEWYKLALSHIHSVSANQVLADGMVGVDREAIKTAIGLVRCLVVGPGSGQDALSAMESALRSAKGEVEG